jgi:hypothetical protein
MVDRAERFKRIATKARAIPGRYGIRPHSVKLLTRSWTGEHSGDGGRMDTELPLTEGASAQNPKVRWLNAEEMAVAMLEKSTVRVGPITADHSARTWLDDIRGDGLDAGEARYLVITGPKHPTGAKYVMKRINVERGLHYMIDAESLD